MPLSKIQADALRLLASQRDPESYGAGATPLNRDALRYSGDIDVFHDREERVALAALSDAQILEAAGFGIRWIRRLPAIYMAEVTRQDAATRLEWVVGSDFRFFPTIRDETFGYVLHPVDLAMNKVMAAACRREVRDLVDLVTVHETIVPLGAVVWAAVEKSLGYTSGRMKIILSRKGFDSSTGKRPSFITQSGELVSLPIPVQASFLAGAYSTTIRNECSLDQDRVVVTGFFGILAKTAVNSRRFAGRLENSMVGGKLEMTGRSLISVTVSNFSSIAIDFPVL